MKIVKPYLKHGKFPIFIEFRRKPVEGFVNGALLATMIVTLIELLMAAGGLP